MSKQIVMVKTAEGEVNVVVRHVKTGNYLGGLTMDAEVEWGNRWQDIHLSVNDFSTDDETRREQFFTGVGILDNAAAAMQPFVGWAATANYAPDAVADAVVKAILDSNLVSEADIERVKGKL